MTREELEAQYLRALAAMDMHAWRAHNHRNERIVTNQDMRAASWGEYYQKRREARRASYSHWGLIARERVPYQWIIP